MSVTLTIDTREAGLQQLLSDEWNIAPLEIGDAEIRHPDFRIVIERKTSNDLAASVKDGRYHEQKARILATIPARHCVYIIECPASTNPWNPKARASCTDGMWSGAILHTMLRDGIHVVFTKGMEETAQWITAIAAKCQTHPEKFVATIQGGYAEQVRIKTKKIENVDPRTCFILQLGQIPGVSAKLATAIAGAYPSWRSLLRALDERGSACLRDIPLIGPKKAALIEAYLRDDEEQPTVECPSLAS